MIIIFAQSQEKFLMIFSQIQNLADSANSNAFNDDADDSNEENKTRRKPLIFRYEFFRCVQTDGNFLKAECLSCQQTYSGTMACYSNFVKHLKVSIFSIHFNLS